MTKEEFHKFLNGFSLTQLKDYIKQQYEKEVKISFKEQPLYKTSIEKPYIKPLKNMMRCVSFRFMMN